MHAHEIKLMIEAGLADSTAEVTGDGTHFEATVVCPAFEGKTLLARHRLVYATLGEKVGGAIHALSIRAFTPEEWERQRGRTLV
jgi:acid stress-induced BolA-like protein IbaG/YrbA